MKHETRASATFCAGLNRKPQKLLKIATRITLSPGGFAQKWVGMAHLRRPRRVQRRNGYIPNADLPNFSPAERRRRRRRRGVPAKEFRFCAKPPRGRRPGREGRR